MLNVILCGVLVASIALLSACSGGTSTATTTNPGVDKPVNIQVLTADGQTTLSWTVLPGQIEPLLATGMMLAGMAISL